MRKRHNPGCPCCNDEPITYESCTPCLNIAADTLIADMYEDEEVVVSVEMHRVGTSNVWKGCGPFTRMNCVFDDECVPVEGGIGECETVVGLTMDCGPGDIARITIVFHEQGACDGDEPAGGCEEMGGSYPISFGEHFCDPFLMTFAAGSIVVHE